MKLALAAICAALVIAAAPLPDVYPPVTQKSSQEYLGGEHFPLIYSGSGTCAQAKTYTTPWLQIGYSPSKSGITTNANIGQYNPQVMTLGLKLACYNVGDSARVTTAYFEQSYDTTLSAFWNADSSNIFIKSGNYSSGDYGVWRFEVVSDTARRWLYTLRIERGGFVRLVFQTTVADTSTLTWNLTGEH